ncbi:hypothetical protein Tco_1300169, partial [Tanacetum coccineum]
MQQRFILSGNLADLKREKEEKTMKQTNNPTQTTAWSGQRQGWVNYNESADMLPGVSDEGLSWLRTKQHKQLKKHVDYEQLINVLAMDKSMLEEELRAIKSKLKLYDSKANATCKENACCKGKLQMLASKQMQPTRQTLAAMQMLAAKESCKCLQESKCNLRGKCLL